MLKDYIKLVRSYPRFLAFSCLHVFFSSPGQSFSFAIFAPFFANYFQLGAGGFGTLYSIATLTSAGLLPFFGPIIDRFNLRIYSVMVGLLMMVSMLIIPCAPSVPVLFIGVLCLRFSGQGLMVQIGGISANRFFGEQRGKALAIVGVGISLGLGLFPMTLAYLISRYGWQMTLIFEALFVLFVFFPISISLLKKTDSFQHPPARSAEVKPDGIDSWTRNEVLRVPFFYFAIPVALLIPFFSTGLIIHLGSIAGYKGWSMQWVASSFIASAILGRVGSFCMGPLVDRFSARRLFPFVLLPYAFGLTVLVLNTHPYAAPVWLGMAGLGLGSVTVTMSALWAETFGIHSLGSISSLVGAITVFASALSPVLFGFLLDYGLNIDLLILSGIILAVIVSVLGFIASTLMFPTRS